MIHQVLAHWKAELAISSIVAGIVLLGNQFTAPTMLAAMQIIASWEAAFTKQTIISLSIGTVFSLGTWWLQKKVNEHRKRKSDENAANLERIVEFEKKDKARIALEQVELTKRVSATEKLMFDFRERIALMDQTVKPLFEAVKIKLIETLTHPSPEFKIPDALLAIAKNENIITPKLKAILKERETSTHPEVTAEEKLAAAILPIVIDLVTIEKATIEPLTATVQVVSSPAKPEAKKKAEEAA